MPEGTMNQGIGASVRRKEDKKFITGKGNAGKQAVIAAVKALGHLPEDDNEADALALLHFAREQMIGGQS